MDIFTQQKIFIRTIIILVALNIGLIGFLIFKEMKPRHEPLLFPRNEQYKDLTNILKKELNLSDTQVAQFDEIRKRNFKKQADLTLIMRNDKDAMNSEMFNKNTDEFKIRALAQQSSENEYKMEMLRFAQAKELKAVCNADQLNKFQDLVLEIRDYFRPDNQPKRR